MQAFPSTALFLTALLLPLIAQAEKPVSDQDRIQGRWTLTAGETNGKDLEEVLGAKGIGTMSVTFDGDSMTMSGLGVEDHKYTFTLDSQQQPSAIIVTTVDTGGKARQGSKAPGIYAFEGETLKLCLGRPEQKPPQEFSAPTGSGLSLLVLKRAKSTK